MIGVRHRLADVTELIESSGPDTSGHEFVFIDLGSVDPRSKRVVAPRRMIVASAPARARQRLRSGDVLVSTLRPHLNCVASVPPVLDGAIATTGFSVLRPRPAIVDERYLFRWVQGPEFIADITRLASGASVPAVSDALVRATGIRLPPLPEQRRIARVLDEADQIRHDRREAIGLLDELARSSYLDLVESASRSGTVHDLVESAAYGTSARTNAPPGGTNAVPIIRVSDITGDGELDVTHLNTAELDARELAKYSVQEGDVLFSRTASAESVSKTTIFRGDLVAAHAAQVVRLRPRHTASAEYLAFFLNRAHTKESLRALATINPTNLLLVSVPLPSFAAQALFAQQLRDIASVKANELAQLARLDELYAALQNRAFSGRL